MKKRLLSLVVLLLVSCFFPSTSLAVKETCSHGRRTFNDKKLTSGVGEYGKKKRYFWIDSDFSKNYKEQISNAFKYWTYTSSNPGVTTSISIKKSSLKSDATFEIHKKKLTGNMTGLTEFYSKQKKIEDPSASNWTWGKIYIDQNDTSDYSNRKKTGLVAHEIGHTMGLSHQPNRPTDSIMYNYDDERKFSDGSFRNRPSKRDCNNINHIY